MREFALRELIMEKCHICGCKNKLVTPIINIAGKVIGRKIRCCACGRTITYMDPAHQNYKGPTSRGKKICIQPSYCPHKDCPLYGTYGKNEKNECGCNMDCFHCTMKCQYHTNDNFPYRSELTVKVLDKPKFR